MTAAAAPGKPVNLALQGGGAHGAFTWGVLDALLEDGRLQVDAVSGTSAGAMNGAALIAGLTKGGRDEARAMLRKFWRAVARIGRLSPLAPTPLDRMLPAGPFGMTPVAAFWDVASRFFSPYDLNPFDLNPLRGVVERVIDFEALHACDRHRLFISATNVHTGRGRLFTEKEVTVDAVMASACLPFLFRAVEIDGVPYWDGGYMGNPALYPFFRASDTEDVLLVQINPVERRETPRTARDILDRMNEITFNSSLIGEFRAIEFVERLIDRGALKHGGEDGYRRIRMHRIGGDEALSALGASTKFNADWGFLSELRDAGRSAAQGWLRDSWADVGVRATLDLRPRVRPEGATA